MTSGCWVLENYEYRPCFEPKREFRSLISLHNHSAHSMENLATLNRVAGMRGMRPFKGILRKAFGFPKEPGLDYSEISYNPPMTATEVWRSELATAHGLGFEGLLFALTDHNEVDGGLDLLEDPSIDPMTIGLGEELSFVFEGHLFHLGIVGLPANRLLELHKQVQTLARKQSLDELFRLLQATGCLLVLNHPLLPWDGGRIPMPALTELLSRYGWAIDALEFNGMRCRSENDAVLTLASRWNKPMVGGGDSHMLMPGSVLGASRHAETMSEFICDVKQGRVATLILKEYHAPLGWKLFLRVLAFIEQYRSIASYRGIPINQVIGMQRVHLDSVGVLAREFLRAVATLHWMR